MKKIKSLLDQFEQLQANSEEQGQVISKENLKNLKGGDGGFGFRYRGGVSCGWFCDPDNND